MADDDEDLDNLDLNGCKEKIALLQADRERKREYTERLQEKFKALVNELAARKQQLETMRKVLYEEQAVNKQLQAKRQQEKEEDERASAEEDRIRLFLEEVLHSKLPPAQARSKEGFKTFDETDLMVNKPLKLQLKEQTQIDTVLITHIPPNTDLKYQLTYRVDPNTTARKLRQDACMFWEVSEVEYILKTMDFAKVQDDLTIQTFFKEREEAHLCLVQKTPKNQEVTEVETKNIKAKFGRDTMTKSSAPSKKKADVVAAPTPGSLADKPLHVQLQKTMPGLWNFMSRRDDDVKQHRERIKLRDIVFFALLLFISMATYQMRRPPGREYFVRSGPADQLLKTHFSETKQETVTGFEHIRTMDHVFEWLETTVPDNLMLNSSALRSFNYLLGPLRIRTQRIRAPLFPGEHCTASRGYATGKPGVQAVAATGPVDNTTAADMESRPKPKEGTVRVDECMPVLVTAENMAVNPLPEIQLYWEGFNNSYMYWNMTNITNGTGAGAKVTTLRNRAMMVDVGARLSGKDSRGALKPWQFTLAEESAVSGTGNIAGHMQSYDASGYIVDYNLVQKNNPIEIEKLRSAYTQDMQAFRQLGWIDKSTRFLLLSFTAYNGNFDMWTSNNFMLEFPPNGIVLAKHDVWPFKPNSWEPLLEFAEQELFELDLTRMCLVLYILYHVKCEMNYDSSKGRPWYTFFTSYYGLCDMLIVLTAFYAFLIRLLSFGMTPTIDAVTTSQDSYQAWHEISYVYNQIFIIDAAFFSLLCFRLVSFLRINRHVFVLWMAIYGTMQEFFYYAWVFVPIMSGFVLGAHCIYGSRFVYFSSYSWSVSSLIMLINGDLDYTVIYDNNLVWTLIFSVTFYLSVGLFLIHSFIAIIVDEYEGARISSGYDPSDYNWREHEYGKWCCWVKLGPLPLSPLNGYFWFRGVEPGRFQNFWNKIVEIKVGKRTFRCLSFLKPIEIPEEEEDEDEDE